MNEGLMFEGLMFEEASLRHAMTYGSEMKAAAANFDLAVEGHARGPTAWYIKIAKYHLRQAIKELEGLESGILHVSPKISVEEAREFCAARDAKEKPAV